MFFYLEHDKDSGFMSNFSYKSFTAPDPASWIFEAPNPNTPAPPASATIEFRHSDQCFMYCKALYFGDKDTASMILKTNQPTECKSLGRAVTPFSQEK